MVTSNLFESIPIDTYMPQYFATIKPYRDDFMTRHVEKENKMMGKHFNYLKTLLREGKLVLAGPTLLEDDPFGVYIFETETEEEARELLDNDPAVKAGIQLVHDFRPIRVSLIRGMDLNS